MQEYKKANDGKTLYSTSQKIHYCTLEAKNKLWGKRKKII